jgi:nicotinamide mononucleotide transporter
MFDIDQVAFQVWEYPVSWVELIASVFGLVSVFLASKAIIWTWPIGIVNEVFLFILFFQVQLYANMSLQVFFFVVTLYGWYHWGKSKQAPSISALNWKWRGILMGIMLVGTVLAGLLFKDIHELLPKYFKEPQAYPFADSAVMMMSIVGTVLLARKNWETWILWIAVDAVSMVLSFQKAVYFLAMEYVIFLGLSVFGLYQWKKEMRNG